MSVTVVLGSNSPRRTQLLAEAGVDHVVHAAEVDESLTPQLEANPLEACGVLAERKARGAIASYFDGRKVDGEYAFIGSDTMVVLDNIIFGKPVDQADARRMLEALSGRTHQVMTSVCVCRVNAQGVEPHTFVDISDVTFKEMTNADINSYLACGESSDKAGAYAIQGEGGKYIAGFEGNWDTIVGLPAKRLVAEYGELLGL